MPKIRNFYAINTMLACAGQPNEQQLKQLAADGFQTIINLGLLNTVYALADEAASVAALGMGYYHIPIKFDKPQISELADFIAYMNQRQPKKIMVHCAANYRASVFTGLYLFSENQVTEEELHDMIDDVWQPNAVWAKFLEEGLMYLKKVGS